MVSPGHHTTTAHTALAGTSTDLTYWTNLSIVLTLILVCNNYKLTKLI